MKKSDSAQGLLEEINADAAQLVDHIRCSNAPEPVLQSCTDHIRAAMDMLQPWLHEGVYSAAFLDHEQEAFVYSEQDLTRSMPYSPVSGRKNPISPAIKLWTEGDKVRGEAHFSATYAGPPDSVHGGIIAAVFDELLSMANIVNKVAGFTGSLTIKYHRPTPLNTIIDLSSECTRISGRKVISRGEMRVDGKITATAEGLFIVPVSNQGKE